MGAVVCQAGAVQSPQPWQLTERCKCATSGPCDGAGDNLHLQPLGNGFVPPRTFAVLLGAPALAPLNSVAAEGTAHSLDREHC